MNLSRRWAPPAALAVLAVAWSVINVATFDAAVRHGRTWQDLFTAAWNRRQLAAGRPPVPPVAHNVYPTGWWLEWRLLGPGLLVLVGAAVLAVLLRRRVRGPWWLAAVVAPAFTGGYGTLKEAFLDGAAGYGPADYATPMPRGHAQGFDLQVFSAPTWFVGAVALLGVTLILAPALCAPRRVDAVTVTRPVLVRSLVVAGAAELGLLVMQSLGTSTGPDVAWRGPVGAVPLILAIAFVLQHAERARTLPWLIGGAAAILAGTTGNSVAQLAWALATAAAAVTVAALALLPWSTARARLNAQSPASAPHA